MIYEYQHRTKGSILHYLRYKTHIFSTQYFKGLFSLRSNISYGLRAMLAYDGNAQWPQWINANLEVKTFYLIDLVNNFRVGEIISKVPRPLAREWLAINLCSLKCIPKHGSIKWQPNGVPYHILMVVVLCHKYTIYENIKHFWDR